MKTKYEKTVYLLVCNRKKMEKNYRSDQKSTKQLTYYIVTKLISFCTTCEKKNFFSAVYSFD